MKNVSGFKRQLSVSSRISMLGFNPVVLSVCSGWSLCLCFQESSDFNEVLLHRFTFRLF